MNEGVPSIVIDFRKNRIRIHQTTLNMLDDPKFIRLLVNPVDRIVALQISDHTDTRAHRVAGKMFEKRHYYELYSRALLQKLLLCSEWDAQSSYKMDGAASAQEGIAIFRIDDSICLTNEKLPFRGTWDGDNREIPTDH